MENVAIKLKRNARYLNPALRSNAEHLISLVDRGEVLSDWELNHLCELEGTAATKVASMYAIYIPHVGGEGEALSAVLLLSGLYSAESHDVPRLFETQHGACAYVKTHMVPENYSIRKYAGGANA